MLELQVAGMATEQDFVKYTTFYSWYINLLALLIYETSLGSPLISWSSVEKSQSIPPSFPRTQLHQLPRNHRLLVPQNNLPLRPIPLSGFGTNLTGRRGRSDQKITRPIARCTWKTKMESRLVSRESGTFEQPCVASGKILPVTSLRPHLGDVLLQLHANVCVTSCTGNGHS